MTMFITLSEDEFETQFQLVENHLNPQATWTFGDSGGYLFATYGEEFEFIQRQDPACVWTVIDGNDGDLHIVSGLRHANRIGFLISRNTVPSGVVIDVSIPLIADDSSDDVLRFVVPEDVY